MIISDKKHDHPRYIFSKIIFQIWLVIPSIAQKIFKIFVKLIVKK